MAVMLMTCAAACGKKGPPLPPLSTLPRAPEAMSARLQGDQVQIRFRVPSATQSNVRPANLQRVDVYALTGPTVPRDRFLKLGTVVASVPVRAPVPEGGEPAAPAAGEEDAIEQGALAIVYETLTPESFQPVTLPDDDKKDDAPQRRRDGPVVVKRTPLPPPDIGRPIDQAPTRHYAAVGVTRGGRSGMPSMIASVSLDPPPPAPAAPVVEIREAGVDLTWPEPQGLRRPVQRATLAARAPAGKPRPGRLPGAGTSSAGASMGDENGTPDAPFDGEGFDTGVDPTGDESPSEDAMASEESLDVEADVASETDAAGEDALTPEVEPGPEGDGSKEKEERFLPARPLHPWPAVTSGYHVYAVPAAPPETRPSPYSAEALPELLTARPIMASKYTDAKAQFGEERCYVLRVAEVSGTTIREGPPSTPVCVKVSDVFPPAAPRSLAAVAGEGAVSLIWEANTEPDLGGYLVLRRTGDRERTEQLTPAPITETTFRDTKVRAGTRYVYTVIAVDTAKPPNRSEPSNSVEVFAR